MDPKTKLFITKLLEEIDGVHAEIDATDNDLDAQVKIYVSCKEALAVERSEVADLKKSLSKEKESHALTKKKNIALKEKYCVLDKKHKEKELQYDLRESHSQLSSVKNISNFSSNEGCGKCYSLDLKMYSTNLANVEVMRKQITRLNDLLKTKCESAASGKENQPRKALYKDGRHPHIKDGLGHTKGGKYNGRKIIDCYECVKFISKGKVGTKQPAQKMAHKSPRAAQPAKAGSAAVMGGSAAPHRKGKATNFISEQIKPNKKVYQPKKKP